jgi:hypothetical protein
MYWPEECPRISTLPTGDIIELCLARWSKKDSNALSFHSAEKKVSRAEMLSDVDSLRNLLKERCAETSFFVVAVQDDLLRLKCIFACRAASFRVAIPSSTFLISDSDLPILTDVIVIDHKNCLVLDVGGSKISCVNYQGGASTRKQFLSEFSFLSEDFSEREVYSERALLSFLGSFSEFLALEPSSRIHTSFNEISLRIFFHLATLYLGGIIESEDQRAKKTETEIRSKNHFLIGAESTFSSLVVSNSDLISKKYIAWGLVVRFGKFDPRFNSDLEKQLHVPVMNSLYVSSFGIPLSSHPSWNLPSAVGLPITNSEGRIGQPYYGQTFNLSKVGEEGKLLLLDQGFNLIPKSLQRRGIIMGSKGLWHNSAMTAAMDNNGIFYLI